MRIVGRGHGAIRATHHKTLELTADADITERATCVIAVDARPAPAEPLAGPVRIEIRVGGESFTVRARANSSWDPSGPAVIRRSPLRLPGTLATHADAASADLPRSLVAAMHSPDALVEVMIEPDSSTGDTVVLFAADPSRDPGARLQAEIRAADAVVAEDPDAQRLVAGHARPRHTDGPRRTLVVAVRDLPGASVRADLERAVIETVGLPARLAAAAASPSRGPLVLAPDTADLHELLRTTPGGHRLVLRTDPDRLPTLLALAAEVRGTASAVIAQEYAPPLRVLDGRVPELASKDTVYCCLDPSTAATALDPPVRAAIAHLLEDGVATRTAARVLADLTGLSRREAYDLVLRLVRPKAD